MGELLLGSGAVRYQTEMPRSCRGVINAHDTDCPRCSITGHDSTKDRSCETHRPCDALPRRELLSCKLRKPGDEVRTSSLFASLAVRTNATNVSRIGTRSTVTIVGHCDGRPHDHDRNLSSSHHVSRVRIPAKNPLTSC